VWTIAGAVAAGLAGRGRRLNLVSWRMIFFINLPAGAVALFCWPGRRARPARGAVRLAGQISRWWR